MTSHRNLVAAEAVLELYQLAQRKNVADFPAAAVEWLQKFIDFDMALLGLLSHQPSGKISMHFGHLVNESAPVLDEWVALIGKDKIVSHMVKNVGRALSYYVPKQFKESPQILDFAVRSRHLNVLAAASHYGERDILTGLSLRRADADWVFTPTESHTLEVMLPHMTEALRINRSLFSTLAGAVQGSNAPGGVCICDKHGYIIYQDDVFEQMVSPALHGGSLHRLPPHVNEVLDTEVISRCTLGTISLNSRKVGALRVVVAHSLSSLDTLTAREKSVAESYGNGLTHKEIGAKLSISPATARRHVESIYAKLGVHTKADLTQKMQAAVSENTLRSLEKFLGVQRPTPPSAPEPG